MYGQNNGFQTNYQQGNGGFGQTPAPSHVEMSLDQVMQGGAPGLFDKNDPIGTSHEGEITGIEAQQQTDFQTGAPLFYPNGNPKPQVVIHLRTNLRNPERSMDDGVRAFYVKGYSIPNLRMASQRAGVGNFPRVGDRIRITFSETKPSQTRGYADAKIYSFQVTPGNPQTAALDAAMADPYATQQQAQTQQPVPPAMGQPTQQQAQQVMQLKALGKTPEETAAMTGLDVQTVRSIAAQSGQAENEL